MTTNQVFATYKLDHGIICSPGKFEGEPVYAPHMHEAYLASDSDDVEDDMDGVMLFVLDEDREEFPELEDIAAVQVWQDNQGFVHTMAYPEV
jgi:hypothetical protein